VNPDCANQPRFAALLGNKWSSRVMASTASTSESHPHNLPSEPSTSSHSLGYLPPPHFMRPIISHWPQHSRIKSAIFLGTTWHTSQTTQSTHVSIPTSTSIPLAIIYSAVILSAFVII
jgi:hypothetical protein